MTITEPFINVPVEIVDGEQFPGADAPPCPDWCRGVCVNCDNQCGRPNCRLWHEQKYTVVNGVNLQTDGDEYDEPNYAEVALGRQDTPNRAGDIFISLDLAEHSLHLTPAQARELAAALNRLADQGEGR